MDPADKRTPYWFIYCAIYVVCFVGFSLYQWLYLKEWQSVNWMSTLGVVSSASLGVALLAIINLEGVMYMVLFAPRRIKELIEKGRQESDAEWEAWLQRRDRARESGEPFDEPPPSRRARN